MHDIDAADNAEETADVETVIPRSPRVPRHSAPRPTVGSLGALFCGDTIFECGQWLNDLFPLR